MLQKSRAIVLHAIKYGDSSLIVDSFTGEWGRKSFLLKGIRKSRKNNRASLFQPMHLLDLDVYFKDNRELQWIREAAFPGPPPSFTSDVRKSAQALFLAEVLKKTLHHEEKDPELFGFLSSSVEYLEHARDDYYSFHLVFLFKLTRFLGIYPSRHTGQGELFFHHDAAKFSAFPRRGEIEREKVLGRLWASSFDVDYETADQLFVNQEQRNLFLDSLLEYCSFHLENFNRLKSLEVLRSVFH